VVGGVTEKEEGVRKKPNGDRLKGGNNFTREEEERHL